MAQKLSKGYLQRMSQKSLKYFGNGGKPSRGNCPGNQMKQKVGAPNPSSMRKFKAR